MRVSPAPITSFPATRITPPFPHLSTSFPRRRESPPARQNPLHPHPSLDLLHPCVLPYTHEGKSSKQSIAATRSSARERIPKAQFQGRPNPQRIRPRRRSDQAEPTRRPTASRRIHPTGQRVIIPNVNLLVYTYDAESPYHSAAKRWWEGLVNGVEEVRIPWVVSIGFIRLMTNPKVLARPASPAQAFDYVREWFRFPHITPINPGDDHMTHFHKTMAASGGGTNEVTDSHIAAIAAEYQAEIHSNDNDFRRFPGVRWRNPL